MHLQIGIFLCLLMSTFFLQSSQDQESVKIEISKKYKKMYEEYEEKDCKKTIEEIKNFHESNGIGYNITLVYPSKRNVFYGVTPLDVACAKDLDFAHYLLDEQGVHVSPSALHFFAFGVKNSSFSEDNKKFFNYLLEKKADINGTIENKEDFNEKKLNQITPLGFYLKSLAVYKSNSYDSSFVKTLLRSGAQLRKECDGIKRCNAIHLAIDPHECDFSGHIKKNDVISLVACLFSERLYAVKKDWLNLALVFSYMHKEHRLKMPKVIMHYIGNILFRSSDAYEDIIRSLVSFDFTEWNDEQRETFVVLAQTKIKYALEKGTPFSKYKDLHEIMLLPFWQKQSFPHIIKRLDELRNSQSKI